MLITKMEQKKKDLFCIDFDYEFTFALYAREIRQFHLKEGIEVSEELVELIKREIIVPRARRKAMSLLEHRDRTREELKKRLLEASFSSYMAEQAVAYVESYGYINDQRYIENYVFFKKEKKSRKQIEIELLQKGIKKEQLEQYLEEHQWNEEEGLKQLVAKRLQGKNKFDDKERQKQYTYFLRKGYSYRLIQKAIQDYLEEQDEDRE